MTALLKEREFHIGRFICVLFLFLTMRGVALSSSRRLTGGKRERRGNEQLPLAGQGKASTIDTSKGSIGRQKKVPSRG